MRESFSEYKKTLEQVLYKVNFIYSGDVINSIEKDYSEIKGSPLTSPTTIINSIIDIYNKSFENMVNNSSEIVIPLESITDEDSFDLIYSKVGFSPTYLFCSEKSKKFLGITQVSKSINSLPGYFYNIDRYTGLNLDIYYSPLIVEEDGDLVFYATDGGIQSLVYSIQNMNYDIKKIDETNSNWCHTISYNFYYCKYKSVKIIIRNVSKMRQIKINEILNGNRSK